MSLKDVARSVLSFKALAYYASAAGDEISEFRRGEFT